MRFITRKQPDDDDDVARDADAPTARPMSELIASIEHSVDHFREIDMPGWKYRQIISEGAQSADQALSEAQGIVPASYGFGEK